MTAPPEIWPVISEGKWYLFCDKQNTDGRKHSLNYCRRKIICNDPEPEQPKYNLKKPTDHHSE